MSKSPGASTLMPVNAPYHRPIATRHFLSDSKVTSTRLSEMKTSCRASWQSPFSSVQCFQWDRLYSTISVGIGATDIAREVVGIVVGVSATVACTWLSVGVDVSCKEAGVGVAVAVVVPGVPWGGGDGMMFVGDGIMELGCAVAATDVGVAAGVGVWPKQAARTMRIGRSAQSGSLLIRFLLSF